MKKRLLHSFGIALMLASTLWITMEASRDSGSGKELTSGAWLQPRFLAQGNGPLPPSQRSCESSFKQFADLEEPTNAIVVDAFVAPAIAVSQIMSTQY